MFVVTGIVQAAGRALGALKKMRTGMNADRVIHKRKMKNEMSTLFPHKKKFRLGKSVVWKHKFYCLAYTGQNRIPTTDADKEELFQAGLGEREVEFESLDMTQEDFKELIFASFPRLTEGGGFQFLKCMPNSRNLEVLSTTVHGSPRLLKERVGKCRTYIRPIQQDLDLTPFDDPPVGVSICTTVYGCSCTYK